MENVILAGACRTPTGRFLGGLAPFTAPALGARTIAESLRRAGMEPAQCEEVIMGHVIAAGVGQNPARQAALDAGLPEHVSAFSVNQVCASGLKAVALGAQAVRSGDAEVVVTGGMESMSNAPFLLRDMRTGRRHGNAVVMDALIHDGLWDCYEAAHMGSLCELTAAQYGLSREEQDLFAHGSHRKAMAASQSGHFKEELVPIAVTRGQEEGWLDCDETIRWDINLDHLGALAPVFKEGGTITAGNAPGLNDGAAALLLMSEKAAGRWNVKPLAEIVGYASVHVLPRWYPLAPVESVRKLLRSTGLKIDAFDLVEENEAFAAQTLAVMRELSLDPERVNVHGGAIALGHPIGASGARILVTLIHALRQRGKTLGLATLCLGGGGALSLAIRAV